MHLSRPVVKNINKRNGLINIVEVTFKTKIAVINIVLRSNLQITMFSCCNLLCFFPNFIHIIVTLVKICLIKLRV